MEFGVVSEECAKAMVIGLMQKTNCDIALCTTGIAGPTGGTKDKPVGLCYISCKYKDKIYTFAMNGQTGKMVGDIPIDKKKAIIWWIGICIITFLVFALVFWIGGL